MTIPLVTFTKLVILAKIVINNIIRLKFALFRIYLGKH